MTPRCLLSAAAIVSLAALGAGCDQGAPQVQAAQQLDENARLRREVEDLRRRLGDRDRQVADLLALGDKRLQRLYLVQRIALGSGTGGVDLDGKPGDDAVKVYVEPIDQYGSVIKAPGEVTVQLYDLAAPQKDHLVAECRYDLEATAKAWSSGFISYYYSFTCPWGASAPPKRDRLTVRVEFLDYLTGVRCEAQQVVKIAPPPAAPTAPTAPATAR